MNSLLMMLMLVEVLYFIRTKVGKMKFVYNVFISWNKINKGLQLQPLWLNDKSLNKSIGNKKYSQT